MKDDPKVVLPMLFVFQLSKVKGKSIHLMMAGGHNISGTLVETDRTDSNEYCGVVEKKESGLSRWFFFRIADVVAFEVEP